MISAHMLVFENDCRPIVAVDDDIHPAIVVQVPKRDSSSRARWSEPRLQISRHIDELSLDVPHEQRWFQIAQMRLCELNVIHHMPLADEQILPAIVVVIEELRSPARM